MPRKKMRDTEKILSRPLVIRFTDKEYKRLEKIQGDSDCRSIGEVVRKVLAGKKITFLHRDVSLSGPMEELALIRRELRAIGININQQTHRFHSSETAAKKAFYVNRTVAQYARVEEKVERLLEIVGKLAAVWLRG